MKDNFITSLLVVFALCLGWETWSGDGGIRRLFIQKELYAKSRIANRQLSNEVVLLKNQVQSLSNDSRTQEKAIRNSLGMARENELVFFFNK